MNLYFSLLKIKARLFEGRKLTRQDIYRRVAILRRTQLTQARMIGITGSGAKSTTSALLFHLLSSRYPSALSMLENTEEMIAWRLAKFPLQARFGVFEISGHAPGVIESACALVQPDIAIVTLIAGDHRTNFRGQQSTAQEKSQLARIVAERGGLVLLNADDLQVLAMREGLPATLVRTYGEAEIADYRALHVTHSPSGRLQFICQYGGEQVSFDLGLLGRHFLVPAMASIACAHQQGISLQDLAVRAKQFVQLPGRCSLHVNAQGPTFVCDTIKAPYSTLALSFALLDLFPAAPRRTVVIGQISDYSGAQGSRYRQAYRLARKHADRVIVLGHVDLTINPLEGDCVGVNLVSVGTINQLRQLIAETQLPGEVILLKGSHKVNRMERIALDYELKVDCWVDGCLRANACFACDALCQRGQPRRAVSLVVESDERLICAATTFSAGDES